MTAALREVCAWCKAVIVDGPPTSPVTHGICPKCLKEVGG
jgi:hypothetical protein